jgi:hypothetical protein
MILGEHGIRRPRTLWRTLNDRAGGQQGIKNFAVCAQNGISVSEGGRGFARPPRR